MDGEIVSGKEIKRNVDNKSSYPRDIHISWNASSLVLLICVYIHVAYYT